MGDILAYLIWGISILLLGIVCLFWPQKIQEINVKYSSPKLNPLYNWLKTPGYIIMTRLMGVGMLAMSILFLYLVLRG